MARHGRALVQLDDDWGSHEDDAPFTEDIRAALAHRSRQVKETETAYYRVPSTCAKQD